MTRLEENGWVISEAIKRAELQPTGTYEEMVTFQLGLMAAMLSDISKSLAILADKSDEKVSSSEKPNKWIPVSERLPRASEIVLLSLPEHTMVDGEECFPCVICGHYIGGESKEWGISDGTTVGYGLVAYKHCKPIAWMPLPEPYKAEGNEKE